MGSSLATEVHEVIPVYSRRPFRLPEHLTRLQNSLDAIRLANPMSGAEWSRLLHELVARHPGEDQSIYLQVTRGGKARSRLPEGVETDGIHDVESAGDAITSADRQRCAVHHRS